MIQEWHGPYVPHIAWPSVVVLGIFFVMKVWSIIDLFNQKIKTTRHVGYMSEALWCSILGGLFFGGLF